LTLIGDAPDEILNQLLYPRIDFNIVWQLVSGVQNLHLGNLFFGW